MDVKALVPLHPYLNLTVLGKEPGGIAPPGSRRTVRDRRPSYGSRRPASGGREKVPVGEEPGLVLSNRVQPGPSLGSFPAQSFEFLHGPSNEMLVDMPCEGVQLGAVEGPVIAEPASHLRVDLLGEAGQIRPAAPPKMPGPDRLTDHLPRLGTDGRGEAHKEASPTLRQATPEGIAQVVPTSAQPGSCRPPCYADFAEMRLAG